MVLSLTATGIQSDAADTGTYTWADVVALSSPFLTTHTQASGRTFYRWTGLMLIQGSATLNAWLIALELLGTSAANPGIIQARGTAKVNFARKRTLNSKPFYDKSCQLIVTRTRYLNAGQVIIANDVPTAPLSGTLDGISEVNIYGSEVFISDRNAITDTRKRVVLITKNFESNIFTCETSSTGMPDAENVPANNGAFVNNILTNTTIGAGGTTNLSISNNSLYDSGLSAYAETVTSLSVSNFAQNLDLMTQPTLCFYTNNVNYINSSTYSLAQQVIYRDTGGGAGTTPSEHKKLYTHDLKISKGGAAVQNALVIYSGRTNANFTSSATGLVSQFLLVGQETNLVGYSPQPNSFATYTVPIPIVDYSAYTRQVRSYLDVGIVESIVVDSQVGSSILPFTISLTVDSGITQTVQATAAAVSGIAHTATTITISTSRSIAEIYDSRKAYWRDNGGTPGVRIGAISDFGNLNITIATGAAISPSTANFLAGLRTSGILTLVDPRAYNGVPVNVASGGSITASAGGNFNIQGWIGSGTTISSSAPAIFTVDISQISNFIAGTNVTIQAPVALISAPNFAQNTRVQVARLEPYSVPSTAITVATNIITISGNRFKSATPSTLVYFQLQAGATIPTTTPQITNNTLYFVQASGVADSLTAGQFKLSLTQSGAAIVFSTQGTGSFTLTGITELDNSLAGASGYSVAFTEPNNTLLRVSAQFWQNTTGCTATNFYQSNILWNLASGNAIADTVNANSNPDLIHNALVGNATKVFSTNVVLPSDGSIVTGISFNAQGTISLDPRLFASVAGFPTLTPQAAYLYTVYYRSTLAGIRIIGNQFTAQDAANFVFAGLKLDNIADGVRNTPNTPATIAGGYVATADGSNPISITSGAIYINADRRAVPVTTAGGTVAPTQQQLRDAQALPPSAGVVAAPGSIDSKLDNAGGDFIDL